MEHQAERVDQKLFAARHLGRDVGEDQVIPTVQRDQPVTGGQVDTGLPFGGRHLLLEVNGGQNVGGSHGVHLGSECEEHA